MLLTCLAPAEVKADPFLSYGSEIAVNEQIRVAILKNSTSITISGNGILATNWAGHPLPIIFPYTFKVLNGKLQTGQESTAMVRIAAADTMQMNGKSYRGILELRVLNGRILAVNQLPLEQYLVGLINSEISSTWPMESIKTQAVIARTYAIAKKKERNSPLYDLESTVMDQVYGGSDLEDIRAARGVMETAGEVLIYKGSAIQAFYHANSGGRTEASQNVWGMALPYLQGVEDRYGLSAPTSSWEQALPLSQIESSLRSFNVSGLNNIQAGSLNSRGRISNLLLTTRQGKINIPATKFRMAVGSTIIKSTNFTVHVDDNTAFFRGMGYGHGVGLCQYGARQRALDGFKYNEILSYYYPGTRLGQLSELH